MGEMVCRKAKKTGKKQIYDCSWPTKKGAERAAKSKAKKKGKNWIAGTPFRWGKGWSVYIRKKV